MFLTLQVKERAVELAKAMESEDGVTGAVKAFLKHLPKTPLETAPDQSPNFLDPVLQPVKRCFGFA